MRGGKNRFVMGIFLHFIAQLDGGSMSMNWLNKLITGHCSLKKKPPLPIKINQSEA